MSEAARDKTVLAETDRKPNGHFAPGNKIGQGRRLAYTTKLRNIILSELSEKDVKRVFAALAEKAIEGDVPAAKLYLSYAIGPAEADSKNDDQSEQHTIIDVIPKEKLLALVSEHYDSKRSSDK